jgi:hypothetical protein
MRYRALLVGLICVGTVVVAAPAAWGDVSCYPNGCSVTAPGAGTTVADGSASGSAGYPVAGGGSAAQYDLAQTWSASQVALVPVGQFGGVADQSSASTGSGGATASGGAQQYNLGNGVGAGTSATATSTSTAGADGCAAESLGGGCAGAGSSAGPGGVVAAGTETGSTSFTGSQRSCTSADEPPADSPTVSTTC